MEFDHILPRSAKDWQKWWDQTKHFRKSNRGCSFEKGIVSDKEAKKKRQTANYTQDDILTYAPKCVVRSLDANYK